MFSTFIQKYLECAGAGIEPEWHNVIELLRVECKGEIGTVVLTYRSGVAEVLADSGSDSERLSAYREANDSGATISTQSPYFAEAIRHRAPEAHSVVSSADETVDHQRAAASSFYKTRMAPASLNDAVGALLFDGPLLLGKVSVLRNSGRARYGSAEAGLFNNISRFLVEGLLRSRAVRELGFRAVAHDAMQHSTNSGVVIFNCLGSALMRFGIATTMNRVSEEFLSGSARAFAVERNIINHRFNTSDFPNGAEHVAGDVPETSGAPPVKFRMECRKINGRPQIVCFLKVVAAAGDIKLYIPSHISFTRREKDVIEYLARGLDNQSIARSVGIGVYTVKDHLKSIFSKLGVHTRAGAVARLARQG